MNRRIIKSILSKKFNEWIESIEDESLCKEIKDNSIITGGAITSLLMKEPVNDFDIYFTNFDTTVKVSQYYVDEFKKLHPITEEQSERNINPYLIIEDDIEPKRVRIMIRSAGIVGEKTAESQYKFFEGRPLEEGEEYVSDIMQDILTDADGLDGTELSDETIKQNKYRPVFLTDNAITLSNKIQLVIRFYGDADAIHANYDFAHCTSYWESATGRLTLRPEAIEAILAKELRYVGSLYPVCSFIRTRKFIKKGWHINAGQMLKICLQISELDLKDVNVLEDQLTGVDTAYFLQVIDYLKIKQSENPDFHVEVPYLISIIDKIF